MAFRFVPTDDADKPTAEQQEARRISAAVEKIKQRTTYKASNIRQMARQFYEEWVKDESNQGLSVDQMERLAKRAWDAAETYWNYVEIRTADQVEDEE